jgi:hypothetical protein
MKNFLKKFFFSFLFFKKENSKEKNPVLCSHNTEVGYLPFSETIKMFRKNFLNPKSEDFSESCFLEAWDKKNPEVIQDGSFQKRIESEIHSDSRLVALERARKEHKEFLEIEEQTKKEKEILFWEEKISNSSLIFSRSYSPKGWEDPEKTYISHPYGSGCRVKSLIFINDKREVIMKSKVERLRATNSQFVPHSGLWDSFIYDHYEYKYSEVVEETKFFYEEVNSSSEIIRYLTKKELKSLSFLFEKLGKN